MRDEATAQRLLGQDYWLVLSTPRPGCTAADVDAHLADHLAWALDLEARGVLFLSGPLLEGPGTGPGSGVTVLRADDARAAEEIAAGDPFAVAGLRTAAVHRWRLNEGSVTATLSLGTGAFSWR